MRWQMGLDDALFAAINGAHSPALDAIMAGVTSLGYFPGAWFVAGVVACAHRPWRPAALRLCFAIALTYAVSDGMLKPLIGRVRPHMTRAVAARTVEASPPMTPSFPSGHAATAAAGALAVTRILPRFSWMFWGLATLIAYSRVYLGVHYPTDVVGGAVVGVACAWLVLGGRHPSMWVRADRPAAGVVHVP